jgi:flagellar hook-length control protein FliK
VATRKKGDPADQMADQFAAMFASACFAQLPQPQPQTTPAGNLQEGGPVAAGGNPEIAGSNGTPTPVDTLPVLAMENPQLAATSLASTAAPKAETIPSASVMLSPAGTVQDTRSTPGFPSQSLSGRSAEELSQPPKVAPLPVTDAANLPAAPNASPSDVTLQAPDLESGRKAADPAASVGSLALEPGENSKPTQAPVWLTQVPAPRPTRREPSPLIPEQIAAPSPSGPVVVLASAAKAQDVAPANSISNPAVAGSNNVPAPASDFTLQSSRPETSNTPEMATKGAWMPMRPNATLSSAEQTFKGLRMPPVSAPQTRETESRRAAPMPPEPVVIPTTAAIMPAANATLVDPLKVDVKASLRTYISSSDVRTPSSQNPQIAADDSLIEQTVQPQVAGRDATLVAAFAATTSNAGANIVNGVNKALAGDGFDSRGDGAAADADVDPRLQSSAIGQASFAAIARESQSNGGANSIQSQTISQIIAQASVLPPRQTKSLRLRLRPEELGQIDIELSRDAGGRISAHISADRDSARGVLTRSLDELRETLSRAGLNVDKLQISAEPGLSASPQERDNARSHTRESPSGVANLLTETEASGQPHADDDKLLSLHA